MSALLEQLLTPEQKAQADAADRKALVIWPQVAVPAPVQRVCKPHTDHAQDILDAAQDWADAPMKHIADGRWNELKLAIEGAQIASYAEGRDDEAADRDSGLITDFIRCANALLQAHIAHHNMPCHAEMRALMVKATRGLQ